MRAPFYLIGGVVHRGSEFTTGACGDQVSGGQGSAEAHACVTDLGFLLRKLGNQEAAMVAVLRATKVWCGFVDSAMSHLYLISNSCTPVVPRDTYCKDFVTKMPDSLIKPFRRFW